MPKDLKNTTKEIIEKINHGEIKMKPRVYFIFGSLFTFIGLVSTVIVSTFLTSLISFSLRVHGRMGQYRLDQMIENFPWWTLGLAIVSFILGAIFIRKYDFSYKIKPWLIITTFILAIILGGYIIDRTGLNDNMAQKGPMKGLMGKYIQR